MFPLTMIVSELSCRCSRAPMAGPDTVGDIRLVFSGTQLAERQVRAVLLPAQLDALCINGSPRPGLAQGESRGFGGGDACEFYVGFLKYEVGKETQT
jgi:hypothetical protein